MIKNSAYKSFVAKIILIFIIKRYIVDLIKILISFTSLINKLPF